MEGLLFLLYINGHISVFLNYNIDCVFAFDLALIASFSGTQEKHVLFRMVNTVGP